MKTLDREGRIAFTKQHIETKGVKWVADQLGVDASTVRRYRQKLGITPQVNQHTRKERDPEALKDAFARFLLKGRTTKEITERFGEETQKLLSGEYAGYNLFEQRNRYQELVYILLPAITKKYEVKPKDWKFYIAPEKSGLQEPFMMVQLPDFRGELHIAPLFDVHYGHKAHRHEKFLSYLRWIEETPNVYAILGGDLMENALDDGRGMMYDQTVQPMNQLDEMTVMLSRIAHKCLMATPGNHEERTHKKSGIDVARVLADRLDIPYFDGPVFLSVSANTHHWNFYVFHGRGNSQTKGGKMNMAGRGRKFTNNIHFFISGHVHDAVVEPETVIAPNPVTGELLYETQWIVVCQSFLAWADTYAYRAGYPPPSMGGVAINLFDNGTYRASLT